MTIEDGTYKIIEQGRFYETERAEHTTGYYVALGGHEARFSEELLEKAGGIYIVESIFAGVVSQLGEGTYLGAWRNGGYVYFDVSQHIEDREIALEEAKVRGQLAIWDVALGTEVFLQAPLPNATPDVGFKPELDNLRKLNGGHDNRGYVGLVDNGDGTYTPKSAA